MVFHPSWGYFADTYGLEQVAIERGGSEPGARWLADLIDTGAEGGHQGHLRSGAVQPPQRRGRGPRRRGEGGPCRSPRRELHRQPPLNGGAVCGGDAVKDERVIAIEDVSFSYEGPPVLEHVTLDVERGEMLGIVGPNGGGKSTLLKIILGLLRPDGGKVTVLGRPPAEGGGKSATSPSPSASRRIFPFVSRKRSSWGASAGRAFSGGTADVTGAWPGRSWRRPRSATWAGAASAISREGSCSGCSSPVPWPAGPRS